MKVVFLLPAGTIEWPVPENFQEGFNFPFFCGNIRMTGFFQQDNIHIVYDKMVGMLFDNEATPVPELKTGRQTGTLQ